MKFAPASTLFGILHNPRKPFSSNMNKVFPDSKNRTRKLWQICRQKTRPQQGSGRAMRFMLPARTPGARV